MRAARKSVTVVATAVAIDWAIIAFLYWMGILK
jgi:hypothetical protein